MPCYHPVQAYQGETGEVVFSELQRSGSFRSLQLSCGRCVGCRLERARQWAVRCMHEAQMYDENCFVTLTYREENLPGFMSLRYADFQSFMRRLRKVADRKVRFFMCGEYGGQHSRPHFHACLFGFDFRDKVIWKRSGGAVLYRSSVLERLWPLGFSSIGAVTFESARYVARYVMKKIGDGGSGPPPQVNPDTGELVECVPEFCRMSLKPGIGARWLDKYFSDVFPEGKVVVNGVEAKSPRYYDKRYRSVDPDGAACLEYERGVLAQRCAADNSDDRLAVREVVALARANLSKRKV